MAGMRILLATRNAGKFGEMKGALAFLSDAEFVRPDDIDGAYHVDEDGKTFEENAIKKAREWCRKSGYVTVADDAGIEIDALGGEPGVLSRRWPGYEADDETLIRMTLEKLQGVPQERRTAHLRTVVAVAFPDERIYTVTEKISGVIAREPSSKRQSGYPFRSLFWIPDARKFYIDLTEEEHERLNHRRRALEKLANDFLKPSL